MHTSPLRPLTNPLPRVIASAALAAASLAPATAQVYPTAKIKDAGPDERRINFVVLAEGYTAAEVGRFAADAGRIIADVFEEPPYRNYSAFFNAHAVAVASAESRAKHPGTAADVDETDNATRDPDNAFGTTFDYAGIHRLLYPNDQTAVAAVVAANYPASDQTFVLVNDPIYGGAGGRYATSSTHEAGSEIAIHEIGHSFAGLADEYAYDRRREEAPNLTAESDPGAVKWSAWVGERGVGVYAFDADPASGTKYYRPHEDCMMRALDRAFCAVCTQRTVERIYQLVTPIDAVAPEAAAVDFEGRPLDFAVVTIRPEPNTLLTEWLLDGAVVASGTDDYTLTEGAADRADRTLTVRVTDGTELSRAYAPAAGYVFERSWTIREATVLPVTWTRLGAEAQGAVTEVTWATATEQDAAYFAVERRGEGEGEWREIGRVGAVGDSDVEQAYGFTDAAPLPGHSLYRLRQVDADGAGDYSEVAAVSRVTRWFYRLSPNPTDGPLAIETYTGRAAGLEIRVYDAMGRAVVERSFALAGGRDRREVDLGGLPAGSYRVELVRDGGAWRETVGVVRR